MRTRLPAGKILRSLRRLRTQLPPQLPLAGLRIEALGALYLICCLVSGAAPGVTAWLRRAPLVFLGRISFSVYALHYPILGSLAFIAWSVFSPDQYLKAQGMLAIIALPTVLLAAYLSFRLIENSGQALLSIDDVLGDGVSVARVFVRCVHQTKDLLAETTTTVGSWRWRRMMSTAWRTAAESASDAPPNLCT